MSTEFAWTAEQVALRATLRGYCAQSATTRASADQFRENWRRMGSELGVIGLAADERHGGAGAGLRELGIVAEELGRALVSSPLFASAGLVMTALSTLGDRAVNDELMPSLVTGEKIGALVLEDAKGFIDPVNAPLTARTASGGEVRLTGSSVHVLAGADADFLLCHAAGDDFETGLYLVLADAPGLTRTPIPSLDVGLRQGHLEFRDVPATPVGDRAAGAAAVAAAVNVCTVLVAADQVGVGQAALDGAVEYARNRIQFGRHIGSFQAVRHRCTDMYLALETARSTAYHAMCAIAEDTDDHDLAASMAQLACATSARSITGAAIQVYGGIGFTWEHRAHLHFKRAASNAALIGGTRLHQQRLARRALDPHALAVQW